MSDSYNSPVEAFLSQYDELACLILEKDHPNYHVGSTLCNAEMAEAVCELMDWDCFDLFSNINFSDVYSNAPVLHVLAHMYIAFLRMELWSAAIKEGVGDASFNYKSITHSELWFRKLRDRFVALQFGTRTEHRWIN